MEKVILRLSFYFASYAEKQFIGRKIGQNVMAACINIQIRIMIFVGFWILYFLLPLRFLGKAVEV